MEQTWTYSWLIRNLLAELLMPPTIWVIFGVFTAVGLKKYKRTQVALVSLSFMMIWFMSTTYFATGLLKVTDSLMQWPSPLLIESINPVQGQSSVIVILGGGVRRGALELPNNQYQDVSKETMERLRMGARLAKQTQFQVLVTGGSPDRTSPNDISEGELMSKVLREELGVQVKWLENQSNTTQENAQFSASILKKEKVKNIYLVTHFWHMPRAQYFFEKQGFRVIPVPIGYKVQHQFILRDFFPSSSGFSLTRQILHECIGTIWYKLQTNE
jgi:uncharacterized SAM-binding protein YcdF (DUF218 family)